MVNFKYCKNKKKKRLNQSHVIKGLITSKSFLKSKKQSGIEIKPDLVINKLTAQNWLAKIVKSFRSNDDLCGLPELKKKKLDQDKESFSFEEEFGRRRKFVDGKREDIKIRAPVIKFCVKKTRPIKTLMFSF